MNEAKKKEENFKTNFSPRGNNLHVSMWVKTSEQRRAFKKDYFKFPLMSRSIQILKKKTAQQRHLPASHQPKVLYYKCLYFPMPWHKLFTLSFFVSKKKKNEKLLCIQMRKFFFLLLFFLHIGAIELLDTFFPLRVSFEWKKKKFNKQTHTKKFHKTEESEEASSPLK